jgi:general stress protein 26
MASKTSTSSSNSFTWIATTAAFVVAPIVYYQLQRNAKAKQRAKEHDASLSCMARRGSQLKPPFPELVRQMLSKCRLAYLSTVDTELSSSHLSLMRFTYLNDDDDGEVVIMSTNKKTKKFEMLQHQNGVALLVHDFGQNSNIAGLYSITLNGNCRIVENVSKTDYYRSMHLENNPDYPQFIVGEDIAILCIDVTSARICDINDQVTKWTIGDGIQ